MVGLEHFFIYLCLHNPGLKRSSVVFYLHYYTIVNLENKLTSRVHVNNDPLLKYTGTKWWAYLDILNARVTIYR